MRLLIALALSTLALPAVAEPSTCRPLDQMDAWLAAEVQESLMAGGISSDGTIVRLYMSDAGTWTVVKVTPRKLACAVDFGDNWQTRSDPAPVPEEGS